MTPASPAVEPYVAAFDALAGALPGSGIPWLRDTRREAIERFAEIGFPSPREEQWKYTSVRAIEQRRFAPAPASAHRLGRSEIEGFGPGAGAEPRLVFVDGRYEADLSAPGADRPGVCVSSLAEALRADPQALEPHLARHADAARSGFAALSAAFLGDGACIRLAAGTALASPLHLLFVASGRSDVSFHPRNLVVAGPGSAAILVESYVSAGGGAYLTNSTTEIVLEERSRIEHYKLQQESDDAYHVATLQVRQDRDSRFVSHSVSLGARLFRQDINCVLDGEGAACTLNGLYLATGRQHVDHHTRIDHVEPHGSSEEVYKGIIDGRGRGVFNGCVYVHPGAQGTDARQSNHNLLLSRHAEVDTKPQLEIYADDVQCSHGATVGQLDPMMMFYLRSRGVEEAAARAMLLHGFTRDVVDRMGLEPVRRHVERALARRLPDRISPGLEP